MRTHARAVVIGGGVVGVSTLYHLAKKGWTDSVLVERKELTSGSTWHAAGLLPLFNLSYSVGQIHKYSVALYQTLEQETGLDVGLRQVSNIRLARTRDRMDEYNYYAGVAETIGVKVKFLTPERGQGDLAALRCRGHHRRDPASGGRLHPARRPDAGAGARRARPRGARSTATRPSPRSSGCRAANGRSSTDKGDITCEHVVSATGNFARQTGRMVGIDVPVIPVEHQYIVTEAASRDRQERKAQGLPEMGVLRESDSSWYMREEAGGLLLGPYEKGAPACYVDGPVGGQRIRALPGGPRAPRAAYRDRDRARAGVRRGRRQEGL